MSRNRYEERQWVAAQIILEFHGEGDVDVANATEAAASDPIEAKAMIYALARVATFLAEEVAELSGCSPEEAVMAARDQIAGPARPDPAKGRIFPHTPSDSLEAD